MLNFSNQQIDRGGVILIQREVTTDNPLARTGDDAMNLISNLLSVTALMTMAGVVVKYGLCWSQKI